MTVLTIRPMTPEDVPVAIGLALAEGWHDRTRFFDVVFGTRTCRALVGEIDGRVVATGLAVINGPVGWLGGLIVDRDWRGHGFGRTMTEELIRRLRAAGCGTLSLEATDAGRPMYERMGFRTLTRYHQLEAGFMRCRPELPPDRRVRPMTPNDLPAVITLDRLATCEDRSMPLGVLFGLNGGWILEPAAGAGSGTAEPSPVGFLLPAERAYGAVVAPRFEDGLFLLDLHRSIIAETGSVRAGIPDEHIAAWQELERRGWKETWHAPRMIIGPAPAWRPEWIWGQINSAMG